MLAELGDERRGRRQLRYQFARQRMAFTKYLTVVNRSSFQFGL